MPLRPTAASRAPSDKRNAADYQTLLNRSQPTGNGVAAPSGRLVLSAIWLPSGYSVKSITFASGTTALAGGAHGWGCLYDSSFNLLGQTPNDTAITWAASSRKTFTLATAVVTQYEGIHYIGYCLTATTPPTVHGVLPVLQAGTPPLLGGWFTATQTATAPATESSANVASVYITWGDVSST